MDENISYENPWIDTTPQIIKEKVSWKTGHDTIRSLLTIGFSHMLKYKIDPIKQSNSWEESIRKSSTNIKKEIKQHNNNTNMLNAVNGELDDIYKDAINDAINDGTDKNTGTKRYKKEDFPQKRGPEYTLDTFTDDDKLNKYIKDNLSSVSTWKRKSKAK